MKKIIFFLSLLACTASVIAQEVAYCYGAGSRQATLVLDGKLQQTTVVCGTDPGLPAEKAGLQPFDIILTINGVPTDPSQSLEKQLRNHPRCELRVKRLGNQTLDITAEGLRIEAPSAVSETDWAWFDVPGIFYRYAAFKVLDIDPIEVFADPEADLYSYATYDFEYTDRNTLQQKEAAAILEPLLAQKNLQRDRENPDLLVFIEYFSDRREQYVPPTQQIVTRYKYSWAYDDGWQTRRYIESETEGDYTRINYLSRLSITLLDAAKAREGSKVLPLIWSAGYEILYPRKAALTEFVRDIGTAMLACYPVKTVKRVRSHTYWSAGLLLDRNVPERVAAVIPGSPAEKAGIEAGDRLLSSKPGYGLDYSFEKAGEKYGKQEINLKNYGDFELTRTSNAELTVTPTDNRFMTRYLNQSCSKYYRKHGTLEFTVQKSDGERKKATMTPVETVYTNYMW